MRSDVRRTVSTDKRIAHPALDVRLKGKRNSSRDDKVVHSKFNKYAEMTEQKNIRRYKSPNKTPIKALNSQHVSAREKFKAETNSSF